MILTPTSEGKVSILASSVVSLSCCLPPLHSQKCSDEITLMPDHNRKAVNRKRSFTAVDEVVVVVLPRKRASSAFEISCVKVN